MAVRIPYSYVSQLSSSVIDNDDGIIKYFCSPLVLHFFILILLTPILVVVFVVNKARRRT